MALNFLYSIYDGGRGDFNVWRWEKTGTIIFSIVFCFCLFLFSNRIWSKEICFGPLQSFQMAEKWKKTDCICCNNKQPHNRKTWLWLNSLSFLKSHDYKQTRILNDSINIAKETSRWLSKATVARISENVTERSINLYFYTRPGKMSGEMKEEISRPTQICRKGRQSNRHHQF